MGLLMWGTCLCVAGPHGVGDAVLELYNLDLIGVISPLGLNGEHKLFGRLFRLIMVIQEVEMGEAITMAIGGGVHGGRSEVFG